jgi:SAM-dependent methyltransferase
VDPTAGLGRRLHRLVRRTALVPVDLMNRRRHRLQQPGFLNERPAEYAFALEALGQASPATVLDVGTGLTPWPALLASCGYVVTAIDEMEGYWREGILNHHFHVLHDDILNPALTGPFDAITCISTLEHIPEHGRAMASMFGLLRPGGHLIVTVPYSEGRYIPDVYREPGAGYGADYPYICQVFSAAEVEAWRAAAGAELVRAQRFQVYSGAYWSFGEALHPIRKVGPEEPHHLIGLVFRSR